MRIISGKFGGRILKQKIPHFIRPTTDRLRERIFNILNNHIDWSDKPIVADIFAGTGAMGFEAISMGAGHCYFIESNRKAIEIIKNNALDLQLNDNEFTICKGDAQNQLKILSEKKIILDLCFIDPPYFKNLIFKTLLTIVSLQLINLESMIIVEHSSLEQILLPNDFKIIDRRIDGGSIIQFLKLSD